MSRPDDRRISALLRAVIAGAGSLPFLLHLFGEAGQRYYLLFRPFCHQQVERSLMLGGRPLPVCSRCTGIYLGLVLGALLPWPRWAVSHGRLLVLGAAGLMVLDVLTQELGLHAPHHALRLSTGLLVGWSGVVYLRGSLESNPMAAPLASRVP